VTAPGDEVLPGDEAAEEAEGAPEETGVGDVAVVPFARVREQLGCGAEAGIVVEDRRNLVKVFFPGMDRTFWLDREKVRVVPPGRVPLHPLVERLHRVSRLLGADLIEIYDQVGDVAVFHVFFRGSELDRILEVRDYLGADLRRLRLEPGSMRRVKLNLAFRV
jgi:hypothetical protein